VAPGRPRLLVLNQYYRPGFEATGQLLAQLCDGLADEYDVTVVTGRLSLPEGSAGHATDNAVSVIRVRSTTFPRRRLVLRALNYVTYLAASFGAALRVSRPDVVLCMTDPPVIANVALVVARRRRAPLVVISQDVFPEIAVLLDRIKSRVVVGLLRRAIRHYLRRAHRIVAIGDTMRHRLERKGAPPERVRVISNWVDASALTERAHENEWAREWGLVDGFIAMHSGNVGYTQDLDTLVRSATFLRDLDRLSIVIVGGGARREELIALGELLEVDQIRFLPYQRREALPSSLSAAHVHVVGLARGLSGYVVPSRLYGVLAVARPVIVTADSESEAAQIVLRVGCGIVVPPGRPELLAAELRRAYDGEYELERMGRLGREYVASEADRSVAIRRYRELLRELRNEEYGKLNS
jgi:putative colanic acid biosynthesis glycosyltransferase WcaI